MYILKLKDKDDTVTTMEHEYHKPLELFLFNQVTMEGLYIKGFIYKLTDKKIIAEAKPNKYTRSNDVFKIS